MPVPVGPLLTEISAHVGSIVLVGLAVLLVLSAIKAFAYVKAAMALPAPVVDPYNNDRVNALHEENGWDPEWDK